MFRPSQLAQEGVAALAEKLTASLRMNGDMALATPNLGYAFNNCPGKWPFY